jgi:hypothetical protein
MPRKPKRIATAPSSRDIEARRGALEAELWKVGHTIGLPTGEGQLARNERIAEIQRELDSLPKPEPQETGEAAGSIQIGHFLGSPWRPPPREPSEADRRDEADPFIRFARESGWE